MEYAGLNYILPKVKLLQDSGLGVSELAARTCYNSYNKSENEEIKNFDFNSKNKNYNDIKNSDLLYNLAWVFHHHSILEHMNLTFFIKDTSRGVLQEHARHRIQSLSVKSTRYTMNEIIYIFIVSQLFYYESKILFILKMKKLDFLVIENEQYQDIEYGVIYDKLYYQKDILKSNFLNISLSNEQKEYIYILTKKDYYNEIEIDYILTKLKNMKTKKNIGDNFKHIVTDNWKTDMIVTFNIRSLKNYFNLRDSGAAYFQIRNLAKEIKKTIPEKYLNLILKEYKNE